MKYSLRKTPSHLHLTYKYGETNGGLLGRNLFLEVEGNLLTLEIDLSANLLARNKQSAWYLDAVDLSTNYHKLKSLQCGDNLVRTRLIRAWEGIESPRLRMRLVLNPRGRYLYEVAPHSLFMGGIQLDVQAFLEEESETTGTSTDNTEASHTEEADPHRKHA
ncbi:hypothetical protein JJB11_01190 [Ramlibacter ginsenosidimutans]|uniref:Uncharacterized protein n=1 Tax=Ramlibacter ginsenosidimutans TaxID=502333 RepID=A0A934TP96_9BURK|nr:hypothetical protein [Ramlibacter ginsenosidimutans]MBK6004690.1 hypothetical protein [Ramlibacter ginsenosidimutans]